MSKRTTHSEEITNLFICRQSVSQFFITHSYSTAWLLWPEWDYLGHFWNSHSAVIWWSTYIYFFFVKICSPYFLDIFWFEAEVRWMACFIGNVAKSQVVKVPNPVIIAPQYTVPSYVSVDQRSVGICKVFSLLLIKRL